MVEHDAEKACVAECPSAVRTAAACAETRCVCSEGQREDGSEAAAAEEKKKVTSVSSSAAQTGKKVPYRSWRMSRR